MPRNRSFVRLFVLLTTVILATFASIAVAGETRIGEHKFTLPEGFEIELIAGPPLVDRPITADFDEQGRLYVSDSSGSNDKVEKQLAEKPHRILRLEDTDGDGRFDKSTVFADKMMFPEGTMWLDGSLYVAAPPSIWKLTDTDGDGIADLREEWFKGKTLTGCANDLHGPYEGPDGWIYWCKGAFATQTYEREGKSPLVTRAAHIFRARPDGSRIEPVMTGGMDNPVDVVFTPGGERIFTTTFLQHPGGGKRDGLIHAVYGGVYGKIWDVIEDHPRTGEVLPPLVHLGAAAPCGLTRYESAVYGNGYRNNIFACLFNMHKVTRHVLEPEGATFKAATSDFVVSDNLDFHPTDILEDADGSLVVINTGGWYKLCCPTSQLHKPDILGGIYRVRRQGAASVNDPRGLKINWDEAPAADLALLLADERPVVARRAMRTLSKKGEQAIAVLTRIVAAFDTGVNGGAKADAKLEIAARRSASMRENAVWTLARIDHAAARAALGNSAASKREPNASVRLANIHSISLWRDSAALSILSEAMRDDSSPQVRRQAAEACGRIGDAQAIASIRAASHQLVQQNDRFFEHALTFALIEIGNREQTKKLLEDECLETRRITLIALDQMPGGNLQPVETAALLGDTEPLIRETAAWVVGRHPEWGNALAGYLASRLKKLGTNADDAAEVESLLARFAGAKDVQELAAQWLEYQSANTSACGVVLRAMARSGNKELPAVWNGPLTKMLDANDAAVVELAVNAVRALPMPKEPPAELVSALLATGTRKELPAHVRLGAFAAVPGGVSEVSEEIYQFLYANLSPELDVSIRATAADVLARSQLTQRQLIALTEGFHSAGPLEADRLLPAYKESADEAVGLKLVESLRDSPALTGLRIDALRAALMKYPPAVQTAAAELYQLLNVDLGKQKEKLDLLLANLKDGDVRRGQIVFNSSKAACAACHPFGYLGGNVGPDLTRIGGVRQERDLLEAIVFPSASFVRSFEPIAIVLKNGKVLNGLVKNETASEIVLATGPKEEVRVVRDDIEEMRPSSVSVMPSGLDQQLSSQDLADLIAFLKAAK